MLQKLAKVCKKKIFPVSVHSHRFTKWRRWQIYWEAWTLSS